MTLSFNTEASFLLSENGSFPDVLMTIFAAGSMGFDSAGLLFFSSAFAVAAGISIGIERVGGGEQLAGLLNEKGTNFHPGGDMIVNDQKGGLYKEIVQFPGQQPFIPLGRNVYIPDAPIGTKVYRASRTKQIMQRAGIPKYANGVGIPEDSKLIRNLKSLPRQNKDLSTHTSVMNDIKREIIQKIVIENVTWNGKEDIIKLLERLANQDIINQRGEFG